MIMHSKKELPFMDDHCMAVFTGQTAKIYQSVTGDRQLILTQALSQQIKKW